MTNYHLLAPLVYTTLLVVILTFTLAWRRSTEVAEAPAEPTTYFCDVVSPPRTWKWQRDWGHYEVDRGKALFKMHCAFCHNKNMRDNMTGPALGGVYERWYPDTTQLTAYLRDPAAFLDTTQLARPLQLHREWGEMVKPTYQTLTDDDIWNLLAYIEAVY